jgi:DNA end-binding protein Ku
MLDLARHIIETRMGTFDPAAFDDRYDAALAELVRAKAEGRTIEAPKPAARGKVVDLMEALRRSAEASGKETPRRGPPRGKGGAALARRKAG